MEKEKQRVASVILTILMATLKTNRLSSLNKSSNDVYKIRPNYVYATS